MSRVLLDTDVLINLLRARPATRSFLFELTRDATPCCSVVSVAELYAGMRESERQVTTNLLDSLIVIPVTREIAEIAGALRRTAGKPSAQIADCLVAATGVVEAMPVATGNVKHYRVPGVTVLPAP